MTVSGAVPVPEAMMAIEGSCLCGALRYAVDGPLSSMWHCHCSRCRKFHGAPFGTYAITKPEALRWISGEEAVVTWRGEAGGPREFCGRCGAVAPSTLAELGITFIPAGNLDADPGIRPEGHMFAGSKAPWYEISDELPQCAAYPPQFGDSPGLPDPPLTPVAGKTLGSCLCGQIGYEMTGEPFAMFQCHCSRCRKSRSAAHGANIFFRLQDFRWTRGEALVAEYKPPEAKHFATSFCRNCGSAVPRVSVERGVVVVPAAALDTDPGMKPMAHIFVASKAPWFEITGPLPQHAQGPPQFPRPPV
jgi:hypothetical protein